MVNNPLPRVDMDFRRRSGDSFLRRSYRVVRLARVLVRPRAARADEFGL